MANVALEAEIPVELDEALARLASARGKTKSRLIREALAEFALSEEAFAAAVAEGRAAVDAGDVVDHDEMMRQTSSPQFAEECRRQSRLIRQSETALSGAEDEAWEAASEEALSHEER